MLSPSATDKPRFTPLELAVLLSDHIFVTSALAKNLDGLAHADIQARLSSMTRLVNDLVTAMDGDTHTYVVDGLK